MAALVRGDRAAFDVLYRRHRDWVARLARRFSGRDDDALDITQDAFCHLFDRPVTFVLTGKLTTYLYPVVKNLALSHARRRRRHAGAAIEADALPAPTATGPSELEAVVAGLPEAQREVLLMRFIDDLSLAEIAEALSIPLGTVKSRLHHAVTALRADPRTRDYFLD